MSPVVGARHAAPLLYPFPDRQGIPCGDEPNRDQDDRFNGLLAVLIDIDQHLMSWIEEGRIENHKKQGHERPGKHGGQKTKKCADAWFVFHDAPPLTGKCVPDAFRIGGRGNTRLKKRVGILTKRSRIKRERRWR